MRDLAIDEHSGKVVYLVVSVGSFLIENNLIAVAPDALVPAGTDDGTYLLLADPNGLKDATRFASDGKWPKKADVIRSEAPATVAATDTSEPAAAAPSRADHRHRNDRESFENRQAFRERTGHHRYRSAAGAGETRHGDQTDHDRCASAAADPIRPSRQRRRRRAESFRIRAGDFAERQLLEDRHQRQRCDRAAGIRRVSGSAPSTELTKNRKSTADQSDSMT